MILIYKNFSFKLKNSGSCSYDDSLLALGHNIFIPIFNKAIYFIKFKNTFNTNPESSQIFRVKIFLYLIKNLPVVIILVVASVEAISFIDCVVIESLLIF